MISRTARLATLSAALVAVALTAACTSANADSRGPDWSPQPAFPGDGGGTPSQGQPAPSQPGSPSGSGTPGPSAPHSSGPAIDPNVVATNLDSPVGLTVLPDGTALVGERTTGRLVRVQPIAGQPVQIVRTIAGIDPVGGGGLMDLALSPSYAEDDLIFAYITTASDNRVVDFTLGGPVTPVLTGIPKGASDNAGRIMFGADGELYVGTGDAGTSPTPANLAGKVLRVDAIGQPAPGNPTPGSAVLAGTAQTVDGLCSDTHGAAVYVVQSRPQDPTDAVDTVEGEGLVPLKAPAPATGRGLGGCAVDGSELYLASRDGKALLAAPIDSGSGIVTLGAWSAYFRGTYGRLVTVVAAPDGSLWLTTSNRDGLGQPVPDDDRVLHIQPPTGGATSPL